MPKWLHQSQEVGGDINKVVCVLLALALACVLAPASQAAAGGRGKCSALSESIIITQASWTKSMLVGGNTAKWDKKFGSLISQVKDARTKRYLVEARYDMQDGLVYDANDMMDRADYRMSNGYC